MQAAISKMVLLLDARVHKNLIQSSNTAKELWDGLRKMYDDLNDAEVASLAEAFEQIKKGDNEAVDAYVTRAYEMYLKVTRHEDYKMSVPLGILKSVRGLSDNEFGTEERVFRATGYPKTFEELRARLLAINAEANVSARKTESEPVAAFIANRSSKAHLICYSSGNTGHIARECSNAKGGTMQSPGFGSSSSRVPRSTPADSATLRVSDQTAVIALRDLRDRLAAQGDSWIALCPSHLYIWDKAEVNSNITTAGHGTGTSPPVVAYQAVKSLYHGPQW
ncbi:hypothetical protein VOLCADRAFT_94300 [Volvox carteri f. nagariensis]|uniref:CCHC-type domain-containing protein n=1 Tax=Volvox carteri f. nagariensis TaxID=3068 RepID=D8U451_VOLCA|nr:uncharacterized protein VOLCADRAFT_94300 [Volvox carteri f. nagariensis]EFJ45534.1 hypothetical protein VOLCADRAFT_94300 [Volvox carteri f. nagariensis]|eukprot:XP_002953561.1 hypothetical protein VOLCADRAFT_94300 [Volvox carteri f. nagariensis]